MSGISSWARQSSGLSEPPSEVLATPATLKYTLWLCLLETGFLEVSSKS